MSHKNKATSITFGLILTFGLIIYFGFKFIQKNLIPDIQKIATEIQKEAHEFARGKKSSDCLNNALERSKKNSSIKAMIKTRLFLQFCLKKAQPEKDLCTNVPPYGEIIQSATWSVKECSLKGHPDNHPCTQVMQEIIKYCNKNQKMVK